MSIKQNQVILGIDPGLQYSGYGILRKQEKKVFLLDCGFLPLSATKPIPERIGLFYDFFSAKIKDFVVTDLALETPFLGKNAQNFLKLGYLRGNLYLMAHQNKVTLHEFSPREIKQAITGWGGAPKEQIARVVLQLFPMLEHPKRADVTDALAVMITALWRPKTVLNHTLRQ